MDRFIPSSIIHSAACFAFALGLSVLPAGCSKSDGVVQWPALKDMDEWAEKGEGWAEEGKIADMRKALPDILSAGEKLAASAVPGNAKDPAAVAQTMGDFKDLLNHLKKPGLTDDDLKVQVGAIHPLVAKLMEASGLPHVHEHEEKDKK